MYIVTRVKIILKFFTPFIYSILYLNEKEKNASRLDYVTLSNIKRALWHLTYLNACIKEIYIGTFNRSL